MRSAGLLLLLAAAAVRAQETPSIRVVDGSPNALRVPGVWKMQAGDDPRWADPAFDDSAWTAVSRLSAAAPHPSGYSWHRIRFSLPARADWRVLLAPSLYCYEIYANGARLGSFGGELGTLRGQYYPAPAIFPLPREATEVGLAIRSYQAPKDDRLRPRLISESGTLWIGSSEFIAGKAAAWRLEVLEASSYGRVLCAGLGFGGLFFLLLPIWRRGHAEFFWCGLLMWAAMGTRMIQIMPDALDLTLFSASVLISVTNVVFYVAWLLFMCALFRTRPTWFGWILTALSVVLVIWGTTGGAWTGLAVQGAAILVYVEQGWRTVRRPSGFAAIHGAIALYLLINTLNNLWLALATIGVLGGIESPVVLALLRSPILLFFYAMGVILHQRASLAEADQQRLRHEVEAAAQVQALLLPLAAAPGVESVYLPAAEVGGDFYFVREREDGSRLVLVGDVSGKGLKAAMLVSVAIGILRNEKSDSPATVLGALNDGLTGHTAGGFVTCCCARFDSSGFATLANAGHPSPYCDGRELDLASGLPLGVMTGVTYESAVVRGDRFTFVSDGVVEAANTSGELFGFQRTEEISTKSAREIAEAARAWGQNDDITVVTVRRSA